VGWEERLYEHEAREEKEPFTKMLWAIVSVSIPASVTLMCSMVIDLINLGFIGHTNDAAKIAGIGLGNMYVNIVSRSLTIGLNSAISALAA
jgi:Na+-driven multidrug efflux pump